MSTTLDNLGGKRSEKEEDEMYERCPMSEHVNSVHNRAFIILSGCCCYFFFVIMNVRVSMFCCVLIEVSIMLIVQ